MARLLARIGSFSGRRRWFVLAGWLVLLVLMIGAAGTLSKQLDSNISVSGVQSIDTLKKIDSTFGTGSKTGGGNIVFAAPKGQKLTHADAAAVAKLSTDLAAVPGVGSAPDPFTSQSGTLSPDGRIGYIPLTLSSGVTTPGSSSLSATAATQKSITRAIDAARSDHLEVQAASGLTDEVSPASNPLIGILIGFVILLITFGSFIAAGLPLVTALLGLGTSLAGISAATALMPTDTLSSLAPTFALLLALAVGIDYSLFIVNRHRTQLRSGMTVDESIARAIGTAGSAVVFAALTVIIALVGLSVVQIGFLTQMGLAAAVGVAVAMLVSITLTPALLRIVGIRVLGRSGRRDLAAGKPAPAPRTSRAWAAMLAKRPVFFAVSALVVLGVLALPILGMRVGLPNDGTQPSSTTERAAYDLMSEGFGPGVNGPIEVLVRYPGAALPSQQDVALTARAIEQVGDVKAVIPSGLKGDEALLTVIPRSGPDDQATETLVHTLRDDTSVSSVHPSPELLITGQTAVAIDISQRLFDVLPLYLSVVAGLSFLLLLIVFRSILIPVKATVSFLLSLGATLGVTVAVFQWGWLGQLFGVDPAGPLLSFLPILVIGVLFGLSMDYEMFIVSGMREQHAHGAQAREAVAGGFQAGAKVVAAAALIMIGVFGNGVFTGDPDIKPLAFALAIGILVDAFIVRMTLVPAVMFLFGRAAWWFPRWLERITPRMDIEGTRLQPVDGAAIETPEGAHADELVLR